MNETYETDSDVSDCSKPEDITPKKKIKLGKHRLTKYSSNWQNDHNWLRSVASGEYKAYCTLCKKEFTISHGGLNDVVKHSKTNSHLKITSSRAARNLTSYFQAPGTSTSDRDRDDIIYKTSAAEITSVYHTVKHSLSYNSLDCFQKLLPLMYADSKIAKNVKCGRTKSEAIVCEVLAKEALKDVVQNLKEDLFFSISTDASNKGNRKMFPICVRYFSFDKGIQNKLIDFVESNDETADQITKVLCETLDKHNLKLSQVTSYGADNANVNFGSNHSVFTNLHSKNEKILKANCSVHILHNMSKFACDRLDIDVEAIILKIYGHFSHSAKRRAELMEIFETTEMEWVELLRHVNTRFLSLCPAVERIIKVWPALKSYFDKKESCAKAIEKIFGSEAEETKTLAYLNFVYNVMSAFGTLIKESQGNDIAITEMHESLRLFRSRLIQRQKDGFFGYQTKLILNKLVESEEIKVIEDFKLFYTNCQKYIEKRYNFSDENIFARLKFLNLETEISFDMIENAIALLKLTDNISVDHLYEEFNLLKSSLDVLVGNSKDTTATTAQKWQQLFQQFPKKDTRNMFKLVSFILSTPTSNCFPERVFSQMNLKWSDARNKCSVKLIKAELLVQFNLQLSCEEFFKFTKEKRDILKEVKSSQKYE
ncbi:uncharacterized protein LOC126890380 [Diabrotica virgifera virgifera]|uniref:Zinc finger protein 862-like n=1 Tax=Diabrotica virgifera virgifera TaxID=50390 RepID=A0ABM5KYF2_DIAVI|nr:uncharacterized protein LOC126890380 [Diabrotica virgifera virgifera]